MRVSESESTVILTLALSLGSAPLSLTEHVATSVFTVCCDVPRFGHLRNLPCLVATTCTRGVVSLTLNSEECFACFCSVRAGAFSRFFACGFRHCVREKRLATAPTPPHTVTEAHGLHHRASEFGISTSQSTQIAPRNGTHGGTTMVLGRSDAAKPKSKREYNTLKTRYESLLTSNKYDGTELIGMHALATALKGFRHRPSTRPSTARPRTGGVKPPFSVCSMADWPTVPGHEPVRSAPRNRTQLELPLVLVGKRTGRGRARRRRPGRQVAPHAGYTRAASRLGLRAADGRRRGRGLQWRHAMRTLQ